MNEVIKLLDRCKEISSTPSDNAFANKIGVTRQMVSNWRAGKNYPDAINCAKLAEISGEPLAKIMGIVGEARAISDAEKKVWRRLANAAVLIMCTLPIALFFAGSSVWTSGNLYIMSGYMLSLWLLSIVFINVGNVPYPHEKQGC